MKLVSLTLVVIVIAGTERKGKRRSEREGVIIELEGEAMANHCRDSMHFTKSLAPCAMRRKSGDYLVLVEEDFKANTIVYQLKTPL